MAERKRKKYKNEPTIAEPSKEQYKMAKYVRFNTPKKSTVFQKQSLEYFVGSKAVDTLMNSKWAKPTKKAEAVVKNRDDAVMFMEQLLISNLLYRAKKVPKKEQKNTKDKDSSEGTEKSKSGKGSGADEEKPSKLRKRKKGKDVEGDEEEEKKETKKTDEKKKKKKYKLDVHEEQVFLDSNDLYVWVYDPISPRKMLLGGVVLLGIIGATLFPLWPPSVRLGVYYLSVCGGFFVGSILGIAVCRSILFAVIWAVTMGEHHFWFLPNLLADVGFFDSFKPWYTHGIKSKNKKKKQKEKSSDTEDNDEEEGAAGSPDAAGEEVRDEDIPPPDAGATGDEAPPESASHGEDEVTASEQSNCDHSDGSDKNSRDGNSSSDYEIIDSATAKSEGAMT